MKTHLDAELTTQQTKKMGLQLSLDEHYPT